jgi:hypothetical protein
MSAVQQDLIALAFNQAYGFAAVDVAVRRRCESCTGLTAKSRSRQVVSPKLYQVAPAFYQACGCKH